ncbi:hypothetical protein KXW70_008011, partial [Aspergillus fumigatus]
MLSNSIHPTEKLATTADEVIELLRVFVLKVVTCAAINLQDAPEFNRIMQLLCKEAPHVAQAIAGTIQEQTTSSSKMQGPKLREAPYPSKRKRSLGIDPSYRPSKVGKRKNCCSGTADGSDHQPDLDPVQKKATSHAKEQGQGDQEPLDEGNQIRVVRWAPVSYHSSLQNDARDGRKAVHRESTSLENANVATEPFGAMSASSGSVTLTPREIPAWSPGRSSPSTAMAKPDKVTS